MSHSSPPQRVIFDTNVVISGLIWRGKPYQCLLLARARLCEAFYCDQMLAELTRKLRDKFHFNDDRIRAVAYDMRSHMTLVEITGAMHIVMDDPDDDKFIECAVVSQAQAIVSSDKHLLTLQVIDDIRIITPQQFLSEHRGNL